MDFLQGKTLMHKDNESVSAEIALKKKTLILYYFTASDCEACREFDTKLKEVYSEACYRRVELAVVVVSCDDTKDEFITNFKTSYHDWYAIRFEDELTQLLMYNYGITHIPSVVVVRKNGTIVTKRGKQEVEKVGINVLITWSE